MRWIGRLPALRRGRTASMKSNRNCCGSAIVPARWRRKLGRSRIAQELRRKGIDADEAEEALSAIGEDAQLADAIALAEKAAARTKSDEDPRKTYQRIAAMLARRGFRWDITKEALAQVLQAD